MMRVLFYVEPLILHNKPKHYFAWFDFSVFIYETILKSTRANEYEFRFLSSDALIEYGKNKNRLSDEMCISLQQKDMREGYDGSNIDLIRDIYQETLTDAHIKHLDHTIKAKLGDYVPDFIYSFSPAHFFKKIYPDALLLQCESGVFSRKPYCVSWLLDIFGLYKQSYPALFYQDLLQAPYSEADKEAMKGFREEARHLFLSTSPSIDYVQSVRKIYSKLVLLPLQFSGEIGFDVNCKFRNQVEYLYTVMEQVPEDVAVIVCEHPTALWVGDYLDRETVEYLRGRFSNFFLFEPLRRVRSVSQFLIHDVDAVISISSSVGWQALFWKKPLITLGDSHLKIMGDYHGLDCLNSEAPLRVKEDRDPLFAHLLSHYWVPFAHIRQHNPDWFPQFMSYTYEQFKDKSKKIGFDFYKPIADFPQMCQIYRSYLKTDIPEYLTYFPANF